MVAAFTVNVCIRCNNHCNPCTCLKSATKLFGVILIYKLSG